MLTLLQIYGPFYISPGKVEKRKLCVTSNAICILKFPCLEEENNKKVE